MTGSSRIFDPTAARDRRLMKIRSKPWHRSIDPGVENGAGIPKDAIRIGDLVRYFIELKATIDQEAEGGPETVANIERIVEVLVRTLPLTPDRAGSQATGVASPGGEPPPVQGSAIGGGPTGY